MRALPVRLVAVLCLGAAAMMWSPSFAAAARQPAAPPRLQVCTLLAKAEVKKHLPWQAMFDQMPVEEEPVGATGSSCNFPTVHVQVLAFSQGFIEAARKAGAIEAVAGVGDEAWFRNNRDEYAEIVVKVGARILTLQADADGGIAAVKPRVIALAKAYVATLR